MSLLSSQYEVSLYIQDLQAGHKNVRVRAAEALGDLRDPRAVEPLIVAMKDSYQEVRADAVEALVKIGEPAVIPLIAALQDSNHQLRVGAVDALGRIGAWGAVIPLIAVLKDPYKELQAGAEEALVRIGAPAVLPLINARKAKDRGLREGIARVLEKMGDARVLSLNVVACERLTFAQRLRTLQALSYMRDGNWDIPKYCHILLEQDYDPAIKAGARGILAEIRQQADARILVRPSAQDTATEGKELLRGASPAIPSTPVDELLQPSQPPQAQAKNTPHKPPRKRSWFQQFFKG